MSSGVTVNVMMTPSMEKAAEAAGAADSGVAAPEEADSFVDHSQCVLQDAVTLQYLTSDASGNAHETATAANARIELIQSSEPAGVLFLKSVATSRYFTVNGPSSPTENELIATNGDPTVTVDKSAMFQILPVQNNDTLYTIQSYLNPQMSVHMNNSGTLFKMLKPDSQKRIRRVNRVCVGVCVCVRF